MMDNQYRGLLAQRGRQNSRSEIDASVNHQYRVVSRIRTKIESMPEGVGVLEKSRGNLLEEIRMVVCTDEE